MCWYLLLVANSATALFCAMLGSGLLLALRVPTLKRRAAHIEPYALVAAALLFVLDSTFNFVELVVRSLGRDMTFTTRTDIWPIVVQYANNPILGAGFNTFWAGSRLIELQKHELIGGIVQAHNGYLETYLNGGWVGIGLLGILIVATHERVRAELRSGGPDSAARLIFLVVAVVYNFSEASFNKLSLVWLLTVFAAMQYAVPTGRSARQRSAANGWTPGSVTVIAPPGAPSTRSGVPGRAERR